MCPEIGAPIVDSTTASSPVVKAPVKKKPAKAKKASKPSQETVGKMLSGKIRTAKQVGKAKAKDAAKKTAKPSAKPKAAKAKRAETGNLKSDEAKNKILKLLCKSRMNRSELKEKVPYGSYTSLMGAIVEAGFAKEVKHEDDSVRFYEITAAGRKAAAKE